jgi:hypothetical protein
MTTRTRNIWLLLAAGAALAGCAGGDGDGSTGECDLLTGDLVISEIMANPMGADDGQEYFEIYNAGSAAVDMAGLTLRYAKVDGTGEKTHTMEEIVVEAGDYLVVGDVVPELKPAHVDYGYGNDLGAMLNGGATLSILCGGMVIDEVEYPSVESASFDGVSFGIDGNVTPDHLINDDVENFCPATTEFTTGLFGSPGESNEPCNIVVPGQCSDGGTMRETVSPEVGDLVITEFLADAEGADEGKEWFEIYVATEVDLNGVVAGLVAGAPKVSIDSPECVTADAGSFFLFAASDDPLVNAGMENVDQTFNFTLKNGETSTGLASLFIGIGDVVLDEITYADSEVATSTALDPGMFDPVANDDPANYFICEAQYGDGTHRGTPGGDNATCGIIMCQEGESFRTLDPPTAGQVRITEVMPNPEGAEPGREWFEITALGDFDLAGLQIGKNGELTTTLDTGGACAAVSADDVIVVAHTANDDLPAFDHSNFGTWVGLSNSSTNSTVVGAGDVILDTFTYGTVTEGKSKQLDPDGVTICVTPETDPYTAGATICGGAEGDGNCGTPGEANPDCP